MVAACDGTSAAKRRRERRLRSWWRHERMTFAAALAEAHHHSSPKVGAEQYHAPRRQNIPPDTTSAGTRPGVLKDPVPQGAVAVGYPPLLCTPLLADAAAEAVDARTVRFLLRAEMTKKKEEEEERRRMEQVKKEEEAQMSAQWFADVDSFLATPWARDAAARGSQERRRNRKKRRKMKVPKTSSFLSSRCTVPRQGGLRRGAEADPHRCPVFMVTPLVSGSHLFACLACCLVRQWMHVYVSLQRLFVLITSGKCFVFSALLGSILDTIFALDYEAHWEVISWKC